MNQIFGGNAAGVIIRLILLSIVVGIVLQALDIAPGDILRRLEIILRRIYDMGFGAFRQVIEYFLIGAVLVVPIWLIARLFGAFRTKQEK